MDPARSFGRDSVEYEVVLCVCELRQLRAITGAEYALHHHHLI